jgi:hypothetical protein
MSIIKLEIDSEDLKVVSAFARAFSDIASDDSGETNDEVFYFRHVFSSEFLKVDLFEFNELRYHEDYLQITEAEYIEGMLQTEPSEVVDSLNDEPSYDYGAEKLGEGFPEVEIAEEPPFDERIHSSGRTLTANGGWKLRRKPKDMSDDEWSAFVKSVKAEIGQLVSNDEPKVEDDEVVQGSSMKKGEEAFYEGAGFEMPKPPVVEDLKAEVVESPKFPMPPVPEVITTPIPPIPPVPEVVTPPVVNTSVDSNKTFPEVMSICTKRLPGRISDFKKILAGFEIDSVKDLKDEPAEVIHNVWVALDEFATSQGV